MQGVVVSWGRDREGGEQNKEKVGVSRYCGIGLGNRSGKMGIGVKI